MIARPALPIAIAIACLLTSLPSSAQVTFSIDYQSRSVTDVPPGANRPLTAGDILSPQGGVPQFPQPGTPLITPEILLGLGTVAGVQGSLNLGTGNMCIGVAAGERCEAELDALSYGMDDLVGGVTSFLGVTALTDKGHWHFSIDEFAEGVAGLGPDPTSESENRIVVAAGGIRAGDSCADVFTNLEFSGPPPLGPLDVAAGNVGVVDGDGFPSLSSFMTYPANGLREPNAPLAPPGANPGDNLDALDCDGPPFPGASFPVYFSLDSGFFDPKGLAANAGTAAANGFVGGDIVVTPTSGSLPMLYASAVALGLDKDMPDQDDIDALILSENGIPGFQPSLAPYDWLGGTTDMLFFSVRRNSAILNNPLFLDSIFGVEIEPGDILVPPVAGGNGNPGIFIAAEVLGLKTKRAFDPCGDDLDAMDYKSKDVLIAADYCFGDGGVDVGGTFCKPCPCGNDMPPLSHTGCTNSSGTGARLSASGIASLTSDTLNFKVTGANPGTFGLLVHGSVRLPAAGICMGAGLAQPTQLDGLRCVGMTQRAGTRASDASGSIGFTTAGWGGPDPPAIGLLLQAGLINCQTRQYQVIYREDPLLVCNNALNTTNAVQIVVTP